MVTSTMLPPGRRTTRRQLSFRDVLFICVGISVAQLPRWFPSEYNSHTSNILKPHKDTEVVDSVMVTTRDDNNSGNQVSEKVVGEIVEFTEAKQELLAGSEIENDDASILSSHSKDKPYSGDVANYEDYLASIGKHDYVVAQFLTFQRDPQRKNVGVSYDSSSTHVFDKWYESLKNVPHAKAVIITDLFNETTPLLPYMDRVEFVYYNLHNREDPIYNKYPYLSQLSTNDARFVLTLHWLQERKERVNYVIHSDISDVQYRANIFPYLHMSEEYTGVLLPVVGSESISEKSRPQTLGWLQHVQRRCVASGEEGKFLLTTKFNKLYNCGILGGRAQIVIDILQEMVNAFPKLTPFGNCNMVVLSYALEAAGYYQYAITGWPIHNQFKHASLPGYFIKHK